MTLIKAKVIQPNIHTDIGSNRSERKREKENKEKKENNQKK